MRFEISVEDYCASAVYHEVTGAAADEAVIEAGQRYVPRADQENFCMRLFKRSGNTSVGGYERCVVDREAAASCVALRNMNFFRCLFRADVMLPFFGGSSQSAVAVFQIVDIVFPGAYSVIDDISRVNIAELFCISHKKDRTVPHAQLTHVYVGMGGYFFIDGRAAAVQQMQPEALLPEIFC